MAKDGNSEDGQLCFSASYQETDRLPVGSPSLSSCAYLCSPRFALSTSHGEGQQEIGNIRENRRSEGRGAPRLWTSSRKQDGEKKKDLR
ncbi:hypothetical protein LX36DRAFT_663988 [Colletotrichum falcatum]|nr:hypothetical protein LX36DRAFT_663988 [Colletotrichum falcatum]